MHLGILLIFISCLESIQSLNICNEEEHSKAIDEFIRCSGIYEDQLIRNLQFDISKDLFCDNINKQAKCHEKYANDCFNGTDIESIMRNFLHDKASLALQFPNLGVEFIDNCTILTEFQTEYVNYVTGSDKCSYIDLVTKFYPSKRKCEDEIRHEMNSANTAARYITGRFQRILLMNVACWSYHSLTEKCRKQFTDQCFSSEAAQEFAEMDFKNVFSYVERDIQALDPSFTLKESCDGPNLKTVHADSELIIDANTEKIISTKENI